MIIDSLAHSTPNGRWFHTNHNAGIERLMEHIKRHSVNKTVVSGTLQPGVNEYVLDLYAQFPDLIYPLPAIAYAEIDIINSVLECYKRQGIKAVKVHPRWIEKALDDPWIDDVFSACEKQGLAVFVCTVINGLASCQSTPKILGSLCARHKDLKIVLLHGGYTNLLNTAEEIRPYENVMLDISYTLPRFYDSSLGLDMKFLMRTFDRRILIGTDFPEFTYDEVAFALKYLGVQWDSVLADGLLGRNFSRFLLSDHE
jgi:predicted TIM-barrel fold metal-dependent hydrolase